MVKKIVLFVGTTGGPVQIERLTPESAPQSVVCESGTTRSLPISLDYHDYIRPGNGLIQKIFGPFEFPSFRADVIGRIDTGLSWQLPFFIAHAIDASKNCVLISNIEEADRVIWATGKVNVVNRKILTVNGLDEKINSSEKLFDKLKNDKHQVTIIYPKDQIHPVPSQPDFEIILACDLDNILGALQLNVLQYNFLKHEKIRKTPNRLISSLYNIKINPLISSISVSIVCLLVVLIFYFTNNRNMVSFDTFYSKQNNQQPTGARVSKSSKVLLRENKNDETEHYNRVKNRRNKIGYEQKKAPPEKKQEPKIPAKGISLKISAALAPIGDSCISVNFGLSKEKTYDFNMSQTQTNSQIKLKDVCNLSFVLNMGDKRQYISLWLKKLKGQISGCKFLPDNLSGSVLTSGTHDFTCRISKQNNENLRYDLIILSGNVPVTKKMIWLKHQSNFKKGIKTLLKDKIQITDFPIFIRY